MLKRYAHTELHVSTTSGFTPSSATLKATGRTGHFNISDLTPGTTYYWRIRHLDWRGNASNFCAEQTFVAGHVELEHIDPALTQNACGTIAANHTFSGDASSYVVPLDTVVCNEGGTFSTGTGIFTTTYDGSFLFTAQANVFGGAPGDSFALCVQWYDADFDVWRNKYQGPFVPYFTQAGADQAFATLSQVAGSIAAGSQFRLAILPSATTSGNTWTVGGVSGSNPFPCQMSMIQLLSS